MLLMPELARRLALLDEEGQRRLIASLTPADLLRFDADFEMWANKAQLAPDGEGWRTWLMLAGRGFGKTRAGAEWITRLASQKRRLRIALVGASEDEVRAVMIEGESGLLAAANGRRRPKWEPSLKRLTWPGGSQAFVYSGENPDGLRGPVHHFAWCDELAKWARPDECWANLQLGLRCGRRPRALVTTTPRAIPILKAIGDHAQTVKTHGRTSDNAHLTDEFVAAMIATYGGTRFGRQELDGEIIEDADGTLWPRALIEGSRQSGTLPREEMTRVVVGVDPPASAGGDACGIVVCGLGPDGAGYVLADHSVAGASPEGWARAVADAAEAWDADRVVAERNMGGEMVESVLRGAAVNLPVRMVHASRGKAARAEPVAALFEGGRAKLAGAFPALEDELAGLCRGGRYEGPGRSPDRADAMVWAMTELMLAPKRAEPRARQL
jgi:phage terminase large subunit-like protein